MKRSIQIIAFLLGIVPYCSAQPGTILKSERFTDDVGLASNIVTHFAQDNNGLIWIATANGLSRFDGINFKSFKKNYTDSNSLLTNIVTRVAVDSKNNIWIGYGTVGLSCYNQQTGQFRHFIPDSSDKTAILPGTIDAIGIDKKERIWIGIARQGLMLLDPVEGKFTHMGLLPFVSKERSLNGQLHYNRLTQFLFDDNDTLWMATGDGLYTFNTETRQFGVYRFSEGPENIHEWKPDVFNTLCRVGPDDFYLGGWGTGLNHYNLKTGKWKNYLLNNKLAQRGNTNIINQVIRKSETELWVASNDTTLCIFNMREEKFEFLTTMQLAPSDLVIKGIRTLFTDRDGDLWIGHSEGFNFLNQSKPEFTLIPHVVSYTDNQDYYYVSDVFEDPVSGETFISTSFADGLNVTDRYGITRHYPIEISKGEEPFMIMGEIFNDSKNNLWIPTRDVLYHFDRLKKSLIKIAQPVSDTSIKGSAFFWKVVEDKHGNIWIPTSRHGVYIYDPANKTYTQLIHKPGNNQSLLSNRVVGLEIDPDGRIWLGYKTEGISCYDPVRKTFVHLQHDSKKKDSPIDNNILSLHADKTGNLWIASLTGLSKLETLKTPYIVNNFLKDQELLGIIVLDVETDHDGNVWFSNSRGLSMFSPATGELKNYNVHNGLPALYESIEIHKGNGRELILSTYAGYYRFYPDDVRKYRKPGKVIITGFTTGYKEISHELALSSDGKIKLRPDDNLFNIEFLSINYKNPSSLSYYFRLQGIDNAWKKINRSGMASYTHLPGGDYVFEVKARNEAGLWSDTLTLPIFIATPFYKTTWFTVAMILLFTFTIFFLYRYRIRNIEKNEAIKTRFNKQIAESEMRALRAQMNPHFIFNCLNSINRYIIKNDHKTASLYLTKFAKLIRLILDNSELHEVALSQELEALKLYIDIESLRFDHKFSYEIEVDPEINSESIRVPPMIIQPFVENAIWHGLLHKETQGRMHLRFFLRDDMLVCEIEDNGVGREKAMELKSKSATTRKSMGMKITADRLAIMNEKLNRQGGITFVDMKDDTGQASGTKVIVQMPVDVD